MADLTTKDKSAVITGKVRFCFVHVFEPYSSEEGKDKKYSVCIVVDKNDADTIKAMKEGIIAAIEAGKQKWGTAFANPKKLKLPLRDGDDERGEDPAYTNSYFMNASANIDRQPIVVARDAKTRLTSRDEFYSGVYGRASIRFYPFNTKGNVGVAVGLNNLMKIADGERIGGGRSAEADFKDFAEGPDLGADTSFDDIF